MPVKHILITEPTDPVLRRLAMEFLHKPELRIVCLDKGAGDVEEQLQQMALTAERGYSGLRDCEEVSVDEIWHTANPADSIEECKHKMERALMFAYGEKAPTFHYLSISTVAVLRAQPSSDGVQCSTEEQKHLENEIAVEQQGCKFRIYRLPLCPQILFHPASGWTQFVQHLTRFKTEIEDRIPGYFTVQPLHSNLPQGATIDIARVNDIVQAMKQLLKNDTNGTYFHIRTAQPLFLNQCLCVLAESSGVHLQSVPSHEQQNYVDRLFDARMENFLRYLERSAQVTTAAIPNESSAGQVWFSVPPISQQEFVAACHAKLQSTPRAPVDWKTGLDQKQVVLSDRGVLNYYIGGEGQEMLVLLNAYGQSFRYWERLIPAISRWFRIILWTPRGNDGDTIGLKIASSQAAHADDLEKVLGQEKIENCTLLAWCTGPKLALEYYRRYPNRVASMVFVAASFKGLRQHRSLETEYEKHLESLLEAIEKYPETADVALDYLKGTLLPQGNQACSGDEGAAMSDCELQQALSAVNVSLQELVLHPFHASSVVAYAKQMREFWNHDVVAALDKVKVPVLFVGGDCDRIASQAIAKLVAGMMPEAKYLEIKGGSHYLHYDRWDLLADVIGQVVNTGGKREFSAPYANR